MQHLPVPSGIAKVFFVVGLMVAFAGMGIFFYAIVTTMADGFQTAGDDPFASDGPDFARVGRLIPIAFGLAVPGIMVAGLASVLGYKKPGPLIHVGGNFIGGSVSGSTVAGGDAYVHSPTINYLVQIALDEIGAIDQVISRTKLPAQARQEIRAHLGAAALEINQAKPDPARATDHLTTATDLMNRAGAFAKAGGELVPRLTHLASVLGPAGQALLRFLP
jgi:hypothetical protein